MAQAPIKNRIQFCTGTKIPVGMRVQIMRGPFRGCIGTAANPRPIGKIKVGKGFISVKLDTPKAGVTQPNVRTNEVQTIN